MGDAGQSGVAVNFPGEDEVQVRLVDYDLTRGMGDTQEGGKTCLFNTQSLGVVSKVVSSVVCD